MRAVHLIHSVANPATGPSTSVMGLCNALRTAGVDVQLVTLDWESSEVDEPFLLRFPLGIGPRRLGLSPSMQAWLVAQSRTTHGLVMHSHNLWMMTGYYPYRVRRRHPATRFIVSTHGALSAYSLSIGSRLKPLYWALLQRPALNGADCLHATSEAECEDIRRLGLRPPVAIIPHGVSMPPEVHHPTEDRLTVVYLGRFHPEKGLVTLLRAWGHLESELEGWCLRLVGPDPIGYRAELEALARHLRLRRVTFDGPVVGAAKWRLLEKAEFLVLPSPSENFGMVVAEALSACVPVVATTGTPWSALVARGAGWYCGTTVVDLAAALQRAATTHWRERRRMGRRGREWMLATYGWDRIADRMAITYRWLLQGGAAPPWVDVSRGHD